MRPVVYYSLCAMFGALVFCNVQTLRGNEADEALSRGVSHLANDEFEDAIKAFTIVIEQNPSQFEVYELRATAYRNLGRNTDAMDDEQIAAQIRIANEIAQTAGPKIWLSALRWFLLPALLVFSWLVIRRFNIWMGAKAPDFE